MAPLRRRLSKRVVKSTFQECFEYDLPGHRAADPKRPNLPESRNRTSVSEKTKQEPKAEKDLPDKHVNLVSKAKVVTAKESSKDDTTKKRGSENVKVKGKESVNFKSNEVSKAQSINKKLGLKSSAKLLKIKKSVASRMKAKSAFISSSYMRVSQIIRTKKAPVSKFQETEDEVKDVENKGDKIICEGPKISTGKVLVVTNWQPVVHLEKISIEEPRSLRSNSSKDNETASRPKQSETSSSKSPDLATRLRNALKDPLAEREDNESSVSNNAISNSMVEDVFASTLPHVGPSVLLHGQDSAYEDRKPLRNCVESRVFRYIVPKQPESDSALEDWPESSSENSGNEDSDPEDFIDNSAITDWSGPHVRLILHWQNKFIRGTNELRHSFEGLRRVIEQKNSVIAALTSKLSSFTESPCHQSLNRILVDYDKRDSNKPATKIINSILEYENSHL